jgi:hypothetical protein
MNSYYPVAHVIQLHIRRVIDIRFILVNGPSSTQPRVAPVNNVQAPWLMYPVHDSTYIFTRLSCRLFMAPTSHSHAGGSEKVIKKTLFSSTHDLEVCFFLRRTEIKAKAKHVAQSPLHLPKPNANAMPAIKHLLINKSASKQQRSPQCS